MFSLQRARSSDVPMHSLVPVAFLVHVPAVSQGRLARNALQDTRGRAHSVRSAADGAKPCGNFGQKGRFFFFPL